MKAAVAAKNECELVVLLAEARIGAELKAAQERGEVATRDDNLRRGAEVRSSDIGKATLPEIGIPRQRAAEMKKLAEVRIGQQHHTQPGKAASTASADPAHGHAGRRR